MTGLRALAVALIVIGALIIAYPVITYTTKDKVLDVGPLEVTTEETHRVPMTRVLGGAVIVVGLGLLAARMRKTA